MSIHIQWRKLKSGLTPYVVEMTRVNGKQTCKYLRKATPDDLVYKGPVIHENDPVIHGVIQNEAPCYTTGSIEAKQNIMASLGFSQGVVSNPKADAKIESPMREHIPPTTVSDYLQQRRDQRASEQRYSDNGYWPDD